MSARWIAGGLLTLSGATGLVYEVVWSKALADLLGNSGQAHAVVLATFMGGLALGALLFGRLADRVESPLRVYAAIEASVGLYAFAYPTIHHGLRDVYLSFAANVPEGWRVVPKLLFAAASVLPPTIAMGGTMPVMIRHATARASGLGASLSLLYALNSLGAALGGFLAGTRWLPAVGMWRTAAAAGVVNLALAAVSLGLGLRSGPARSDGVGSEAAADEEVTPAQRRLALLALGLSGAVAMILETGWIRVLTLIVGASTYAFTWIVTAFIVGLSLGSLWVSRRAVARPLVRYAQLQLALVFAVALAVPLMARAPYWFVHVRGMLAKSVEAFTLWQATVFGLGLVVMLVPTALMGAAFPLGARLAASGASGLGRRLGQSWAVNTLGTVLGALLGGLWLLPAAGLAGLFVIAAALSLLAGATLLVRSGEARGRAWTWIAAATAAWVAIVALPGDWPQTLMRLSAFRVDPIVVKNKSYARHVADELASAEPRFIRHDPFASIFVGQSTSDATHRYLLVNGKPDASTLPADRVTQKLVGHLGPVLAPRPTSRALVIGVGSGLTLGSMLTHPLRELDVVEIAPGVIDAARAFGEDNGHALDDPRVRLHVDDARSYLALAREPYDVIVSVPSNPWIAGISALFTEEFMEIVDRRLTDDGILVQWIQAYETSDELMRLVLRTVRQRFPHATAWQGSAKDVLIVASKKPLQLDWAALVARLGKAEVRADLASLHLETPLGFLARQRGTAEELARYAGEGPLNTDAHNRLEYGAPVAFFIEAEAHVPDSRRREGAWAQLLVSRALAEHPLQAADAEALFRAVSMAQEQDDPIRRAAGQAWARLDPAAARLPLAFTVLQQGEVELAKALLGTVDGANAARVALRTALKEREQRAGPFQPLEAPPVEAWLRQAGDEPRIRAVATKLCARAGCTLAAP